MARIEHQKKLVNTGGFTVVEMREFLDGIPDDADISTEIRMGKPRDPRGVDIQMVSIIAAWKDK